MNDDEAAPDSAYVVSVTWYIGDALLIEYPDLQPWEAIAVLEEAISTIKAEERETESDREETE